MMLITFMVLTTFIMGGLCAIWKAGDGFNFMVKMVLGIMTVWGIGLILNNPALFV